MTSSPATGTSSLLLCIIGTRCVLTQARRHRGQRQILTQNFPVLILPVFSTDPLCPSQRGSGGASCDVCTACHKLIKTPPPTKVGSWTWEPYVLFHVLYTSLIVFFCFLIHWLGWRGSCKQETQSNLDATASRCGRFQFSISRSVHINQAPTHYGIHLFPEVIDCFSPWGLCMCCSLYLDCYS